MKSWDVFMDSFVNVLLPDNVDLDTEEGRDLLWDAAISKYVAKLRQPGEINFTWERYPDGDTNNNEH